MNNIKQLRKKHGMKQIELCRLLNIAQGTLSGWETGNFEPDVSALVKMSEIFGETIDYILTGRIVASDSDFKQIPVYSLDNFTTPAENIAYINYFAQDNTDLFCLKIDSEKFRHSDFINNIFILKRISQFSEKLPMLIRHMDNFYVCNAITGTDYVVPINNSLDDFKYFSRDDLATGKAEIIGEIIEIRKVFDTSV